MFLPGMAVPRAIRCHEGNFANLGKSLTQPPYEHCRLLGLSFQQRDQDRKKAVSSQLHTHVPSYKTCHANKRHGQCHV
jgi:hypothetical protein